MRFDFHSFVSSIVLPHPSCSNYSIQEFAIELNAAGKQNETTPQSWQTASALEKENNEVHGKPLILQFQL